MCLSSCYFFSDNKKASHVIVLLVLVCICLLYTSDAADEL